MCLCWRKIVNGGWVLRFQTPARPSLSLCLQPGHQVVKIFAAVPALWLEQVDPLEV